MADPRTHALDKGFEMLQESINKMLNDLHSQRARTQELENKLQSITEKISLRLKEMEGELAQPYHRSAGGNLEDRETSFLRGQYQEMKDLYEWVTKNRLGAGL